MIQNVVYMNQIFRHNGLQLLLMIHPHVHTSNTCTSLGICMYLIMYILITPVTSVSAVIPLTASIRSNISFMAVMCEQQGSKLLTLS